MLLIRWKRPLSLIHCYKIELDRFKFLLKEDLKEYIIRANVSFLKKKESF